MFIAQPNVVVSRARHWAPAAAPEFGTSFTTSTWVISK
jgi:hypothetical protein